MPNTVLACDNFIRPNRSGFGTASDGKTWTEYGTGTLSISSNAGLIVSSGLDTDVQLGTDVATNVGVFCQVSINNSSDIPGIEGRFSGNGGTPTSYKLVWYGGNLHINKAINGVNTELTTLAYTLQPGTIYNFLLWMIGSSLYGKVWAAGSAEPGAWTASISDGSITGPGGIAILGNTAAISTGITYQNFSAYTLADSALIYSLCVPFGGSLIAA